MFTYEEKVYLPSLADTRIHMTGRGKKIALISACKNTYNTVQIYVMHMMNQEKE